MPKNTSFAFLSLALLAGCATEVAVPVIDPAKKCELAPTLMQACQGPGMLGADITYGQLMDVYQADRERLRTCVAQRDALAKAIETCNREIDAHNADLAARLKAAPK